MLRGSAIVLRWIAIFALTMSCQLLWGATPSVDGFSEESQRLLGELEKFDPLDPRRADILEQLAQKSRTAEDRVMWYRQIADTISAAVHSGNSPDGIKRLEALITRVQKSNPDATLVAYIKFRMLSADHARELQSPNADYAKIQTEYNQSLEKFIADYPKAPDAAEAMLQLGIAQEFADQAEDAKMWYRRIVKELPRTPTAAKASGAIVRLDSVGKAIPFSGKSTTGDNLQLANYRGKVVLIQYWATWSEQSKNDMAILKQLVAKYGRQLAVIGVSMDNNPKDLESYLTIEKLPWPQIFEAGGLDSPPANQLGILTAPTMILVNQDGKVVSRSIRAADIEAELKKLLETNGG